MTKPFQPPIASAPFGAPEAILAHDFSALAGPERKTAILLAAEGGCLARLVRKGRLTRRGIERTLALEPGRSVDCAPDAAPPTHLKGHALMRRICEALNAARRTDGHAPDTFFKPDWDAIARDLDRKAEVVRLHVRRAVRDGWLESCRQPDHGRPSLIAVPQSTIAELGLEP